MRSSLVESLGRRGQRGMSLLETVCAITIMGSVSATALPHVVDLSGEARRAVVESLAGALSSAAALTHAKCLTSASCPHTEGEGSVALSDGPVSMWHGYPRAGDAQGIEQALQFSGFTARHEGGRTVFVKDGAPNPAACSARYAAPMAPGGLPLVETDTAGC